MDKVNSFINTDEAALFKVLQELSQFCRLYAECEFCPLYSLSAGVCGLQNSVPEDWELNDPQDNPLSGSLFE